jgi:hypothetical protein
LTLWLGSCKLPGSMEKEIPDWLIKSGAAEKDRQSQLHEMSERQRLENDRVSNQIKQEREGAIDPICSPIIEKLNLWEKLGVNGILEDINTFLGGNEITDIRVIFNKDFDFQSPNSIILRKFDNTYCGTDKYSHFHQNKTPNGLLYEIVKDPRGLNFVEIKSSSYKTFRNWDGDKTQTHLFSIRMGTDGIWASFKENEMIRLFKQDEMVTKDDFKLAVDTFLADQISKK